LLFVITADMGQMNLPGERYQGWIDGGLFAMTLALALHARGLGACFLNWSVPSRTDRALRRMIGIPDSELVITMMSAGHLKDRFAVPVSQRKPLDAVLVTDPPLRAGQGA
jgi:nitroreductase